jgi:hypothetical protein
MATRMTLARSKIRREHYRVFCPTCGTRQLRDGRMGSRNNTDFCSPTCFTKARKFAVTRSIALSEIEDKTVAIRYGGIAPGAIS